MRTREAGAIVGITAAVGAAVGSGVGTSVGKGTGVDVGPGGAIVRVVASVGEDSQLKGFIKSNDWNDVDIIARGNTIVQIWNGHVMSVLVDDDQGKRASSGLLGIQVHKGPAMKIEVRNVRIKSL